ncbi:unnamed protein product [Coregonus sp. 'balchen']|nr:unnamed protein product [Coregonus sp. 'balchen']
MLTGWVCGRRSGLVEVSPPCRLSTADWPVLSRDPSPKGSPPSLENGAVLDPTNQQWRYVTHRGNQRKHPLAKGVSLEMLSPDLTQTRNGFATLDPEVGFKIGSGGTCVFVLCSVSLSGGFYLGFRSSELPPSSDREAA